MYFSARALIAAASLTLSLAASTTCWDETRRGYGIGPLLLKTIVWKESRGWTGAVGPRLKDDNRALGPMQINTIYLPNLVRFGIRREHLSDARTSQKVGVRVLADCIQCLGATWKFVSRYYTGPAPTNVGTQVEYARDVQWFYEGCHGQ